MRGGLKHEEEKGPEVIIVCECRWGGRGGDGRGVFGSVCWRVTAGSGMSWSEVNVEQLVAVMVVDRVGFHVEEYIAHSIALVHS